MCLNITAENRGMGRGDTSREEDQKRCCLSCGAAGSWEQVRAAMEGNSERALVKKVVSKAYSSDSNFETNITLS